MNVRRAASDSQSPVRGGFRFSLRRAVLVVAFTLSVLSFSWPALVNHSPFFLPDTTAYLRSGDALFVAVSSRPTAWSDRMAFYQGRLARPGYPDLRQHDGANHNSELFPPQRLDERNHQGAINGEGNHPPLLGRSIYFGFLIYVPSVLFGELTAVLLSSAIIAYVVWLCLVPLEIGSQRWKAAIFLATCICLSVTTSVAFVSSTLMPDYLSGVLVIALAMLAFFWRYYSRWEVCFLALVVALACLSHTSNLLLSVGLLGFMLMLVALKSPIAKPALVIAFAAIMVGLGGDALFAKAVEAYSGLKPVRPPFLTARLVSDGPGYTFMQQECGRQQFAICQFQGTMPADSDEILWGTDSSHGAFSIADWATQAKLGTEDVRFAKAVFAHDPLRVTQTSFASFVRQLFSTNLDYINQVFVGDQISTLPASVASRIRQARSYRGDMVIEPFALVFRVVAALAAAAAVGLMLGSRINLRNPWIAAVSVVLVSIIINAAVSGALSKPDPRYTLKVLWILPLIVALASCGWRLFNVASTHQE